LLVALAFGSANTSAAGGGARYYLSLGDSLAAGTNATEVGPPFTDEGYADQLAALERARNPTLSLVKLGCPGATTSTMLNPTPADFCQFVHGTQLADAVAFLRAHRGQVAFVTIDIGAGDLLGCILTPAGCRSEEVSMARNLAVILAELRAAAGLFVPIVGMTYYESFAPLCVSDPSQTFACDRVNAANSLLSAVYHSLGARVADVAGLFDNNNLTAAATNICNWTWVCIAGDQHPNVEGYGVIAHAFADALPWWLKP
jgi:lysophospholipase L1-like esterase